MKLLATLLTAAALVFTTPAAAAPSPLEKDVIYQIFVRSFADSNGDRIGDLKGIEDRIGYLKTLGVTTVLLTPLYDSDFYHNYFAKDFRRIDPAFGSDQDFFNLVKALHKNGIKLVIDVEVQYVAEGHPWFDTSYKKPGTPESRYIRYSDTGNQTYEGLFGLAELPSYTGTWYKVATVNLLDPATRDYNRDLFAFWMDPNGDGKFDDGIDGLRIDHMMDDLDHMGKQTGLFGKFWAPIFADLRARNPKLFVIAEQADWADYGDSWFKDGTVDAVFGFDQRSGTNSFDKTQAYKEIAATQTHTPDGKVIINFVENHDTNRFASDTGSDPGKARVGAAFEMLLKGTPLIFYGQEIGTTGRQMKGQTDGNDIPVREAMRWTRDADAPGIASWYRGTGPWWDASSLKDPAAPSVEAEDRDSASLLNWYRSLSKLRRRHEALADGEQTLLENSSGHAMTWLRTAGKERLLVAVNLSAEPADLTITGVMVKGGRNLFGGSGRETGDNLYLNGYGVRVIELR